MWQYNYNYLCHHGILGQKWGIRRFQNQDGSLTPAGRKRYGATSDSIDSIRSTKGQSRLISDLSKGITEFQNDQEKYSSKYFKTGKEKYMQKAADADAERVTTAHQYFKYKDSLAKNKEIEEAKNIEILKEKLKELEKVKERMGKGKNFINYLCTLEQNNENNEHYRRLHIMESQRTAQLGQQYVQNHFNNSMMTYNMQFMNMI